MVQVFLLRHGRTKGNEERRYVGRTDEGLSPEGRREMEGLHDSGALVRPDYLYCSPMKRCRESAEILYPGMTGQAVEEFREIDFGDYEGKTAAELLHNPASGYQKWIDSGGAMTFPNGEARDTFMDRCRKGFARVLTEVLKNVHRGSKESSDREKLIVSIVAHGGTIMSILSGICGGDYYDYMCGNGEGFQVELQRTKSGWNAGKICRIPDGTERENEKRSL